MFVHDLIGGMPKQRAITILSFIAACIGFVALIFGINAKKMALKTSSLKSVRAGNFGKTLAQTEGLGGGPDHLRRAQIRSFCCGFS